MADLISTDRTLDAALQAVLDALLDTLVPASNDGRMPSAAELGFLPHLEQRDATYIPQLEAVLARFDPGFVAGTQDERVQVVRQFSTAEPATFNALLLRVYDCYYQNDRVRRAIGMVEGPVFPQGNTLAQGDLALLDPVLRNSARHQYRKA